MALEAADIVNQGLRAGGLPFRIGELYEGSEAARTALEIFGQARDELIDVVEDWSFCRKVIALSRLKGPPPNGGYSPAQPWSAIYPYPGFLFEYAYPDDCVTLAAIIAPPGPMPDLDPLPALWRIDDDATPVVSGDPPAASGPPQRVILCNQVAALAVYRARITDPNMWDNGFISAVVASLGKKFAVAFNADGTVIRELSAEAVAVARTVSEVRG